VAPKKSQVIHDEWDTYVRETNDGPIFISFDVEAAREDLSDALEHCGQVVLPIRTPGPNGSPSAKENERLYALEDELCDALGSYGVECRLVGRLTHQGLRVLVFQLDNWEAFRPVVIAWAEECEDYAIRLSEGEGWEFFNDCVRPLPEDWLFMADSRVIQNLMEAGSDPEKEHTLEFVFQGEPEALEQITSILRTKGYEPMTEHDPEGGEIIMVKKMTLDLRAITAESLRLAQMAQEHGIEYDGWGAAVVR
jgi:regulator of RNase E activity RraB